MKDGGLSVLDSSNQKAAPRELAKIEKESVNQLDGLNLAQSAKLLFMALCGHFAAEGTNKAGMAIVSVADPRKPKQLAVWGMTISKDQVYLTNIKASIPFRGTWPGLKAVTR